MTNYAALPLTVAGDDIGAPLLPPEPMSEPKSVRLGFVSGLIAADKVLQSFGSSVVTITIEDSSTRSNC